MNAPDPSHAPPRATQASGLFWPLMSVVLGLVAYFLLFGLLVDPLNPVAGDRGDTSYRFFWELDPHYSSQTILTADMSARYASAIPSVFMSLAFLATMVMVFKGVLPAFAKAAVGCGILALPVGAMIGYTEHCNNTPHGLVTDCRPFTGNTQCPLDQAVLRAGELGTFDADGLKQIILLANWNSIISVAAIFLLGIAFVFIARRATEAEMTPPALLARKRALLTTIVLGALVLVFAVATTDGFYHLAPALMAAQDARALGAVGSAGAGYWGAVYTTVILVIAAPPALSILNDISQAARLATAGGDFQARREWAARHGLDLKLRETLTPIVATVSPLLTTPA